MIQILVDNPLLLLFTVLAIGYPLGHARVGGFSLGLASVLFVAIGVSALHPALKLPELVYQLGLVLFVYTMGLSSGPSFFAALRRKGLRDNLLVVALLLWAAGLTLLLHALLGTAPGLTAGLYAGSTTNTPALAAVLEYLQHEAPPDLRARLLAEPVVGYSVAYPMGVVGMLLSIALVQRLWKVDYEAELRSVRELDAMGVRLTNATLRVTRPEAAGRTLEELQRAEGWDVVFGRIRHEGRLSLASGRSRLAGGDVLTVVGTAEQLERVERALGERSAERLELDRRELDYRRIFVSDPRIAGHRLRDLDLPQQFGALVTRVRRGDVELLPHGDTVLELGDRVRVLTRREQMEALTRFFGDSYRALSEIDILTFSLGLLLGLALGLLPVHLPGGITLRLGLAGGPLLVALVLGTLGRTGPVLWVPPYSANLTLRQLGLVLFLAGVGTRAGHAFVQTLSGGGGLALFLAGTLVTCSTALLALWIGHRLLRIPMGLMIGILAGLQTQPAVLGFALAQTRNDLPNVGYATVFPVAMVAKIVLVQVILALIG